MKRIITFLMLMAIGLSLVSQVQYSRVRIDLQQFDLSAIASSGIDVTEGVMKTGSWFETDLSETEIGRLEANGIQVETLIEDVSRFYAERAAAEKNLKIMRGTDEEWTIPENWEYGSMGGYYTLQEAYSELDDMAAMYPDLISEKQSLSDDTLTHEGRKLYWLKISDNPNTNEDEPEVLYTGLHHAREAITVQQTIFFMWYLLENYATDEEIRRIVDNTELYFVPVINPDGYTYNQLTDPNGGGMWRKNRRNNGDGSYGVDLNRNYGYFWGLNDEGSSPNTYDETYRGATPFSEPEIKNIRDFCNEHEFLIGLNYHSYSNLLLSPWGFTPDPPPDNEAFLAFGELMTMENNYTYGPGSTTIYPTNGGSDDWMYGEQDTKGPIYSFTPEVGNGNDGFWPQVSRIIPLCREQMWQNLSAARLAGHYAVVEDISPMVTDETENHSVINFKRLGLAGNSTYLVSIDALDGHIVSIGPPAVFEDPDLLETYTDSLVYSLDPAIENGTVFRYLITLDQGDFVVNDTITRIFGTEIEIFHDDGETTDKWTTQQWNITDEYAYSPFNSITDSPNGDYDHDELSSITLDTTISLVGAKAAFLKFWARWDIEAGYDYVQLSAKEAGSNTWIPLHGKYSSYNNYYLDSSEPIYDGVQDDWVQEEINLMDFAEKEISLRFTLFSDSYVKEDGFYFDELTVSVVSTITGTTEQASAEAYVSEAYPNPASDAFSIRYALSGNDGALFELYNLSGTLLKTIEIKDTKGVLNISVSDLPAGMYYYRMVNGEQVSESSKLIKR